MEALLPAADRTPNANDYTPEIRARANFFALPADEKEQSAYNYQRRGITNCMNPESCGPTDFRRQHEAVHSE